MSATISSPTTAGLKSPFRSPVGVPGVVLCVDADEVAPAVDDEDELGDCFVRLLVELVAADAALDDADADTEPDDVVVDNALAVAITL